MLVGPLVDAAAFAAMQAALLARASGAQVSGGERIDVPGAEGA